MEIKNNLSIYHVMQNTIVPSEGDKNFALDAVNANNRAGSQGVNQKQNKDIFEGFNTDRQIDTADAGTSAMFGAETPIESEFTENNQLLDSVAQ